MCLTGRAVHERVSGRGRRQQVGSVASKHGCELQGGGYEGRDELLHGQVAVDRVIHQELLHVGAELKGLEHVAPEVVEQRHHEVPLLTLLVDIVCRTRAMLVLAKRFARRIHVVDRHSDGVVEEGGIHGSVHKAADGYGRRDLGVRQLQHLLQRPLVHTKNGLHHPYAQRRDVKLSWNSSHTLRAIGRGHGSIDVKRGNVHVHTHGLHDRIHIKFLGVRAADIGGAPNLEVVQRVQRQLRRTHVQQRTSVPHAAGVGAVDVAKLIRIDVRSEILTDVILDGFYCSVEIPPLIRPITHTSGGVGYHGIAIIIGKKHASIGGGVKHHGIRHVYKMPEVVKIKEVSIEYVH